jgi:hypothetical protein
VENYQYQQKNQSCSNTGDLCRIAGRALARWFVPKMVKNGLNSHFAYWSLIWACLTCNLDRVERWQTTGFQQILKEVEFSRAR